ncbi:MAG: MarR family transcriptional regulator [Gammaproteobacteria bacterium]
MGTKLEPLQVLFLWGLLAKGGEAWKGDLKPELHKNYARLVKSGFVDEEQRKHPETKRARKWVRLSDAGWKWAQEHLDAEVSKASKAGGQILQDFLAKLKSYLEHKSISLAEIITPDLGRSEGGTNLPERIRNAFLKETGGVWNTHVRLASLRRALSDIDRRELDEALLAMGRTGQLVLYPLDNPC